MQPHNPPNGASCLCSTIEGHKDNPVEVIRQLYQPGDFIVFKLDVDHHTTEMGIVQQLLQVLSTPPGACKVPGFGMHTPPLSPEVNVRSVGTMNPSDPLPQPSTSPRRHAVLSCPVACCALCPVAAVRVVPCRFAQLLCAPCYAVCRCAMLCCSAVCCGVPLCGVLLWCGPRLLQSQVASCHQNTPHTHSLSLLNKA